MAISECLRGEVLYLDTFRIFSELCKILFWYTDGMGFALTKQGKFSRVSGFVKSLKYVKIRKVSRSLTKTTCVTITSAILFPGNVIYMQL